MQEYKTFRCNDHDCNAKIFIKRTAYINILNKLQGHDDTEVGGILIGYYSTSLRMVYINEFGDAPADSKSDHSTFYRGVKGLGEYLKEKWETCNEYYLGEWHYHPDNVPEPSKMDILQLKIIAVDRRFNCREPILIIFSKRREKQFRITIRLLLLSKIYDFFEIEDENGGVMRED